MNTNSESYVCISGETGETCVSELLNPDASQKDSKGILVLSYGYFVDIHLSMRRCLCVYEYVCVCVCNAWLYINAKILVIHISAYNNILP